jgi:hypothetical protein
MNLRRTKLGIVKEEGSFSSSAELSVTVGVNVHSVYSRLFLESD